MSSNESTDQLLDYFETALALTKEAGQLIRDRIHESKTVETKACGIDFVTETDQEVEELLISGLKKAFPDHKFIGEEATGKGEKAVLTDAPTWIIDPVDGTMNFVHCNPNVAVSVGLYIEKKGAVGIIYLPLYDLLYTAIKGRGAFCNDKRIHVSQVEKLSNCLVALEGGTSRDPEKINTVQENLKTLIPRIQGYRASGSAAINLIHVAEGSIDIFLEYGCHAWDMAAGELIVREAGGVVMDPSGSAFDVMSCRIIAAANLPVAIEFSKVIKQYYPTRDDA